MDNRSSLRQTFAFEPTACRAIWQHHIECHSDLLRAGSRAATLRAHFSRDAAIASEAMKADIHPEYKDITVTCSCGNTFLTRSTLGSDLQIEVCSNCHPFYTGKQKVMDTGGRVDKFRKRYAK